MLAHQIEEIDRELDAIDDQLIANELVAGMDTEQADAAIVRRSDELMKLVFSSPAGAPIWYRRSLVELVAAQQRLAELETNLGPRHPELVEARRRVEWIRAEIDRHRTADLLVLATWRLELLKLPHHAPPVRVREAQLRARRARLALGASDAPTAIVLAVDAEARVTHDLAGMADLGPKHPERVRAEAELEAAHRAKTDAIAAAERALDAELAALPASAQAAPAVIDPSIVSRRAELAARARELRRAYEAAPY